MQCTKVIPKKEVLVPVNTRGAPLTPDCRCSLHTLFSLWLVQGHLRFEFCISKPEQRLRLLCAPTVPAQRWSGLSLSGELPRRSLLGPAITVGPVTAFAVCSSLSSACVSAPISPYLKRLQLYWSVMLYPGLKEVITKYFWLPNLFLRGINLSKSSLIVVFTWTLWSRSLIAELFKIQKVCSVAS